RGPTPRSFHLGFLGGSNDSHSSEIHWMRCVWSSLKETPHPRRENTKVRMDFGAGSFWVDHRSFDICRSAESPWGAPLRTNGQRTTRRLARITCLRREIVIYRNQELVRCHGSGDV